MKRIHRQITESNQSSIAKTRKLRLWLCIICALLGCLWVGFTTMFAPHWSTQDGLQICLGFGLVAWITTSPTFFKRYVGEATPESLGAIRIIVCTILLIMTLWIEDVPTTALLPVEMIRQRGIMQFFYAFPGFGSFVRSQTNLQIFEWLTALVLFLGIIGWKTRVIIPLGAFCYLLLGGIIRQYTWFFHTGLIPTYVLAVLSLTPCGDGLSVDRWWKVSRGQSVLNAERPAPIYGWSRYACWVVIALSYVAAGMSKLRKSGLFWWDASNMRSYLYSGTLDPMQSDWGLSVQLNHAPDILFALLGIAGIYGEIAFGLVLFSRIARWILPLFMMGVHIGIFFLQNIFFFDLIFLQLIFFDFTQIKKTIKGLKKSKNFQPQWKDDLSFASSQEINKALASEEDINLVQRPATENQQLKKLAVISAIKSIWQNFRYPLLTAALITSMIFVWFHKTEFYPFTSLQMFSGKNTSGQVGYSKVLAHYESGVVSRAYPEKIIPAMVNTRYRLLLKGCFLEEPKSIELCNKFFKTTGAVYNEKAPLGQKIDKFELQSWLWDFRNNPSDPQYGDLQKRYIVKVDEEPRK